MQLLNRLLARYGSADGFVVNNRRVAVARPPENAANAVLQFWLFQADGTPISGVAAVTLVMIDKAGNRSEKVVTPTQNRITIAFDSSVAVGAYDAWFEIDSAATNYVRTDPFELHILP